MKNLMILIYGLALTLFITTCGILEKDKICELDQQTILSSIMANSEDQGFGAVLALDMIAKSIETGEMYIQSYHLLYVVSLF